MLKLAPRRCRKSDSIFVLKSHNYQVSLSFGIGRRFMSPTLAILDTGAGPDFVHARLLPTNWRDYQLPVGDIGQVRSATGSPLRLLGAASLYLQLGTYRARSRFIVAENSASLVY